jgi:hypothetical protein
MSSPEFPNDNSSRGRPSDETLEAHPNYPEQYLIALRSALLDKKFGRDFLDEQDDIAVVRAQEDFPDEEPLAQIGFSNTYDLEAVRDYRQLADEKESVDELELFAQADGLPLTDEDRKGAAAVARDLVYFDHFRNKL